MVEMFNVGIADMKVSRESGDTLMALGLGSCVAVALYDPSTRVGGVVHFMLPSHKEHDHQGSPLKFADTAIPLLIEEMEKAGARRGSLEARIAGGASMFPTQASGSPGSSFDVGRRNLASARDILQRNGILVRGEEVGGHRGRTMKLEISHGRTCVRSIGEPEKEI